MNVLCEGMGGNTNNCVPRGNIFVNTLFKGWLIIFKILHVYTMCLEQENLTQIILLNLDNIDYVKFLRLDTILITTHTCVENNISNSTCSLYVIFIYVACLIKILEDKLVMHGLRYFDACKIKWVTSTCN